MRTETDCIFCRIVRGEIPSERIYENDLVIGFRDIQPRAPTHVLIIPRVHIASLSELRDADQSLAGALLLAAQAVAEQEDIVLNGYRVTTNTGAWGGQTVDHLHFHVLGGRRLTAMG